MRSLRPLLLCAVLTTALALSACTSDEEGGSGENPPSEQDVEEPGEQTEDPDEAAGEEAPAAAAPAPVLNPVEADGLDNEVGYITLSDVMGDDAGWVTVGNYANPGDLPTAVIATSENGTGWDIERDVPAPGGSQHRASVVERVGSDTVVVGATKTGSDFHIVTWTGSPGDWTLRELDAELGSERSIGLSSSVVTDDEQVLVVGSVTDEDSERTARIWRIDPDGSAQEQVPFDDPGGLNDVVRWDDALLAVGQLDDASRFADPIVLRSDDDGQSWSEVATNGLDDGYLDEISVVDSRLAIGGQVDGAGSGSPAIWYSDDGTEWDLVLDVGDTRAGYVRGVHRLDGSIIGLGSWLEQTDADDEDFAFWRWPSQGDFGTFGASAEHDGRVVAVGSQQGFPRGLLTATTPGSWQSFDLSERLLDRFTGVSSRNISQMLAADDRIAIAGTQTTLNRRRAQSGVFVGLDPDFERSILGMPSEGVLNQLAHDPDVGWIAIGWDRSPSVTYDGPRVATSQDGERWDSLEIDAGEMDRALAVAVTEDRVVVNGLGWVDDAPQATFWELQDGQLDAYEVEGLGDWVPLTGCSSGDTVVMELYQGASARAMGVSTDGARSFEVIEDGPVTASFGFDCTLSDDGVAALILYVPGPPQIYTFDVATGEWTERPEASEGPRVSISTVTWVPELGWFAAGSRSDGEEAEPLLRRSTDLQTWTEFGFADDPMRASVSQVAATSTELFVYGNLDGQPQLWSLPVDEVTAED